VCQNCVSIQPGEQERRQCTSRQITSSSFCHEGHVLFHAVRMKAVDPKDRKVDAVPASFDADAARIPQPPENLKSSRASSPLRVV
jgi:hypothetical protein